MRLWNTILCIPLNKIPYMKHIVHLLTFLNRISNQKEIFLNRTVVMTKHYPNKKMVTYDFILNHHFLPLLLRITIKKDFK